MTTTIKPRMAAFRCSDEEMAALKAHAQLDNGDGNVSALLRRLATPYLTPPEPRTPDA